MQSEVSLAIRLARVATGRTQWDVAKRLRIHPVTINSMERGKRIIPPILARRMFKELKTGAPRSRLVDAVLRETEIILDDAVKQVANV